MTSDNACCATLQVTPTLQDWFEAHHMPAHMIPRGLLGLASSSALTGWPAAAAEAAAASSCSLTLPAVPASPSFSSNKTGWVPERT